jgi:uncharacterized protein YwqG
MLAIRGEAVGQTFLLAAEDVAHRGSIGLLLWPMVVLATNGLRMPTRRPKRATWDRARILAALEDRGLAHLRGAIEPVIEAAIAVTSRPLAKGARVAVGSSRVGGSPDLPAGSPWPAVDGIPLTFAGQVRLSDLAPFEPAAVLPPRGLLSFFFDGMLTGYERGESPDRAMVIYTDDAAMTDLVRLKVPPDVPERFDQYGDATPVFSERWDLPEAEEIDGDEDAMFPAIVPILRDADDKDRYGDLRREIRGPYIGSKLLGHPDAVQGGEIILEAVRKRDGGKRFRYEDYQWTHRRRLEREMRDLVLLFQSASGTSCTWGGSGVLYFWIDRADLKARRFDRAFAMLQST